MTNFITDEAIAALANPNAGTEDLEPLARQVALALTDTPSREDEARLAWLREEIGDLHFLAWLSGIPGFPGAVGAVTMIVDALETIAPTLDVTPLRDVHVPTELHGIVGSTFERYVLLDTSATISTALRAGRLAPARDLSKAALAVLVAIADTLDSEAWVANRVSFREFGPMLDFDADAAQRALDVARAEVVA